MKPILTAQRTLIAVFVAVIAVVYIIAWMAPAIGLDRDEAPYLITARGLTAGHGYVTDSRPVPVPQTQYPPLFPVVLALFSLVSRQVQWLRLLPLACSAGWLFVTYKLLRKMGAAHYGSLLLLGLTATSPAVVFLSTNLLAEPVFALLAAAALLALLDDRIFIAGTLAGLATITRTAGLPLIAACALTLVVRGRFRRALIFTATAIVIVAPWFGWSLARGANYAASSLFILPASEKVTVLGTNLLWLFASPFALLSGIDHTYAALFTFAVLAVCLWKRRQMMPDMFLLLYCAMALCRTGPAERFLAPVLPLILWLFWRVLRNVRSREALAAVVLVVALAPLWGSLSRISVTLRTGEFPASGAQQDDWYQMVKLFAWIQGNTPRDTVVAANRDSCFYLNTGRKTVRGYAPDGYKTFYQPHGQTVTPAQLSEALQVNGVSYVALTPDRDLAESASFHNSVEALERGGILEPVEIEGLAPNYRLLRTASGRLLR